LAVGTSCGLEPAGLGGRSPALLGFVIAWVTVVGVVDDDGRAGGDGKAPCADTGFVADRVVDVVPGINRVDLRLEASWSAPYSLVDCPSFSGPAGELALTDSPHDALPLLGLLVLGVGFVRTAIARSARSEGLEPPTF
jgi:hypothetical protein